MTELLTSLLNGLGTGVGIVIAAVLALSAFREQQAHQRRLDWYEATLAAVQDVIWVYHKMRHAHRRGNPEETKRILNDELPSRADKFARFNRSRDLYAGPGVISVLEEATVGINEIGDLIHTLNQMKVRDPDGTMMMAQINELKKAEDALIAEARPLINPSGSVVRRMLAPLLPVAEKGNTDGKALPRDPTPPTFRA